jgi:hypothetical protein
MAAFDSFEVSINCSRSAPRMPLRAAYTFTPRARAASITPAAVALITAVTPPDWAYSSLPWAGRRVGMGGSPGSGRTVSRGMTFV